MSPAQTYLTLGIFVAVILVLAFDVLDMVIAVLFGACALIVLGILDEHDVAESMQSAGGPLALLFGGMIVARVLSKTGMFDRISATYLRCTRGSGKRYLLILVLLVTPVCALLPNATTVILLAPVIIQVARALDVDFAAPMVLAAIVSNSAGMLTLVGDPATFLVGSSIGLSFTDYLRRVSLGGLLSVLIILPMLPLLMKDIWRARRPEAAAPQSPARIDRPWFVVLALADLALMVVLFLFGEELPVRIGPPAVAIIAATLALLAVYTARVEPVDEVLRAVDWKTLVFLGGVFVLVRGLSKSGLLQGLSLKVYEWFGADFAMVALAMLLGIGLLSSLIANIPVVAASILMIKGYMVATEAVPEIALSAEFTDWPTSTLPVFVAMMFGATLGGNATMVGASANIVSVGICERNGHRVNFIGFMRYGVPITVAQLAVSALYVLALDRLLS